MVRSITLSEQERKSLLKVYRGGCGRRARQAYVLLLLADGVSYKQIRRMAYVSFTLISKCVRRFRDSGLGGFSNNVARTWKPKRLSDEELRSLEQLLSQGAASHGWVNQWWTAKRVSELIDRHFGKKYSPESARRILKRTLGWSPQRPIKQLVPKDENAIEVWLLDEYPQILRRARRRNAQLVFVDETGFMLTPLLRRTFAPRGHPPVSKIVDAHARISVIGAMAICPVQKHFRFFFHALCDNQNFQGQLVAQFIREIRLRIGGPITLLWDRYCIHRAAPLTQYLRRDRQIVSEFFPANASKLNPVDEVWCYVKYSRLPNYAPPNLDELRSSVLLELSQLQSRSAMLHSLFRRTKLIL